MKASPFLTIAPVLLLLGCGTTAPHVATDHWQFLEGPLAQDITTILVSQNPGMPFLAGNDNGKVYRLEDSHTAWNHIATVRKGTRIHRFTQHPDKPSTVYAATDAGLFVSTNGGSAWTEFPAFTDGAKGAGIFALAIDPWNASVMYAGTARRGIQRTTDGGTSWNPANAGIPGLDTVDVREIFVDPSKPDRMFAAVSSLGVIQSADAGKSWNRLTDEFTTTGSVVTQLTQSRHAPTTIVYGTSAGSIRKSTDGGSTWSPTRNGFTEGTILSLASAPGRPEYLFAGTESGVLASSDFGSSWIDITGSLPRLPVSVAPSVDGQTLYAYGEAIGLQQTTDNGETWTRLDDRLGGATVRFVVTDAKGEHLYASLDHAVLAFDLGTGSWHAASSGLPGGRITSLVVDSDSPLHVYAATTLGGFETTDGGQSWQLATRSIRITPQILEPHPRIHTRMLASGSLGLDVSTDRGVTWRQTKPFTNRYHASGFTYSPKNTGLIYGASSQTIIMSRDGGFIWEASRYGLRGEEISAITLDNQDPSVVYAWTPSGSGYRSLDGGLEWNKYTPPWKHDDEVCIAFDRYNPSSVVALLNGKDIYVSTSGGGTWFALPPVKLIAPVQSLWWNAPTGTLYVGTKGLGVHRISLLNSIRDVTGEREVANTGE